MSGGAVASRPETEETWFRVEATATASAVRRAAERLATTLGLPERRVADLSIVVAEAAGNLVKHAEQGTILLRPVRTVEQAGVEIVALDHGPGMADLALAFDDGHSTTGTLGIGLGAIKRQSSCCDLHSVPGRGTVMVAQVWPTDPPPELWAAGITRPYPGESVSGDAYAVRERDGRRQLLLSDGLGHGGLAAAASHEATRAFAEAPYLPPDALVELLHRKLSHTRGAALAVAELDREAGLVRYAGLGNISGTVLTPGLKPRGMVSLPGIAGHQRRQIRQYEYQLDHDSVVLLHTDGLVDRWNVADYPGLLIHTPTVIAATLLRDAGVRRDDAGVLVAR